MLQETMTVLTEGDSSGNGMLLRFHFPSGLDIYGLPTRNHYGGFWDLGPTWNYLVLAETPFLVDTGRFNQTEDILAMMEKVGFNPTDLGFILLSHGHEDHDGGVAALAERTGASVRVHPVYDRLVRITPESCPEGTRPEFPPKCWNCFMPEEFISRNCRGYHQANSVMTVKAVTQDSGELIPGVHTYFTPGHSPDCLCIMIGQEAIIVGDTILPEITPWPTTLKHFDKMAGVMDGWDPAEMFGLQAYLRSLHKLKQLGRKNGPVAVLPAHRLYYRDTWNDLDLVKRIDELLVHHLNRAAAVAEILGGGPLTPKEIARRIFSEHQLKGPGIHMAANEMLSHLELMVVVGDAEMLGDGLFAATGKTGFEGFIRNLAQ